MPVLAILSWPLLVTSFFARMNFARALAVSTLVGYLLLPEAFSIDLPGLPAVDKLFALTAGMLLCFKIYATPRQAKDSGPAPAMDVADIWFARLVTIALVVLLLSPVLTMLGNRTPIIYGPTFLSALRPWDLFSLTLDSLYFVVPFLLARKYLATPDMHRMILMLLVTAGLFYSFLMLIEVRLSPQLNNWVYGYHQHSFIQHIRDGFRPKVFLKHGLSVGFFMFTVALAAFALYRASPAQKKSRYLMAGLWLLAVLLVSKNLGAVAIAFLMIPIMFLSRVWQLWVVLAVVIPFLIYPAIRQAGLVPTEQAVAAATSISPARAQSLQFRFDNEDALLDHALEKPIFGWGGWGRSFIYSQSGEKTSTVDGTWIIVLGSRGWVGYVSFFALLTLPLLALRRARRRKEIPIETIALALIMTGNIIYLIPNSTLSPIAWLITGALAGFVQFDRVVQDNPESQPDSDKVRTMRFSRFSQPHEQKPRHKLSRR